MKTIFRFLALAMLLATFSAANVTTSYAQDPQTEKVALYKTYTDNYAAKEIEKRQVALDAAKTYVEKFGANAEDKVEVDYFKKAIPDLEKGIANSKQAVVDQGNAAARDKLLTRFDAALKGGKNGEANPSDTYAVGKEILAKEPDFLDVILVLGSVGFDQAVANPAVDAYNDDNISFAKMAIKKLEENKPSTTKNYGASQYTYKTDKLADGKPNPNGGYADGKSNALGAMNYNIGYILYYRQGKDNPAKKKEALPYLYKSTQYNSYTKINPRIYQTIGAWYLDEAIRIDKERQVKLTANGNKDNDETLAMVGEQKGYADRAIDAYSRAYKLAKAGKPNKEYTDTLYTRLTELYKFRYDGKADGIDAFVATVDSKPFPDPTTPITPVKVEPTETTTTTTSTTEPTTKPAVKSATTPVATPVTKPAVAPKTGATKPAGTSNVDTATDGKNAVKKVIPKKKGTR
ncbi:MAG: hypothetical protein LH472_10390 [Pyrinomonadaceae bacterium]|nr:hypothetical protein [Pyrinomonadaceae bacterium]